jgi:AraC family chitin signaling transcriptional activator
VKIKLLFISILVSVICAAQELPPILKFDAKTYMGGNQNWMISQDEQRNMYVANHEGLLEYNGSTWRLYHSPNETIIRSVKVIGDRIYTGCYMEFGYWMRDKKGILKYTSLSNAIKSKIIDDEQFWNILNYDHWVIFQSLNRIYLYDSEAKTFKIISSKDGMLKVFKTDSAIYYQPVNDGIYEIENGKSRLVIADGILKGMRATNIFPTAGGILLQTQSNGFYNYSNGNLAKFTTSIDNYLSDTTIYSSVMLSDGGFALGSISNGLFILSSDGSLRHHITQNQGLGNNTILSLFEDKDKNLWVGLDNGINCINVASPIKTFADNTGILGTVYASILHDGNLYIGTNQGLFYKQNGSNDDFHFVAGTKGQVWSLFEYGGTLFCGHDSGTYIISDGQARKIFSQSGTWKFEPNPYNPAQLFQGNYTGLSILEKSSAGWTFKQRIAGFGYSSRYFEILGKNIYISHEYKGIYRLTMNPQLDKVLKFKPYDHPTKGKNASLAKYNNTIIYAYKEGIYTLNPTTDIFVKDSLLSSVISNDEYTSGKLIVDRTNKLWIFTKNSINYFSLGKLSTLPKLNTIPIPSTLTNSMLGYENISPIGHNHYLVGTTDGYYSLNINDLKFNNYRINITQVTKGKSIGQPENVPIANDQEIKYKHNNITFSYAVPVYDKYVIAEYQYILDGLSDTWSDWSLKSAASFKNLPYGTYTFKVRARVGAGVTENTAEYNFTILRPWYASYFAIVCYFLIIIFLARFIHKAYKFHYQKQNEKLVAENKRQLEMKELESNQKLMQIKNEQLVQDVDSKNRELAASTMNLIKKNELLSLIKDDLKKTDDSSRNIKAVISTINKNISEEDTWDLFKEAFNNADKDFLKKIKQAHQSLTPNDLRLCAYLRLNLSSKEIAPLLNISVRSVEIKRYRLRKKMDLPHEQGLVEYILSI